MIDRDESWFDPKSPLSKEAQMRAHVDALAEEVLKAAQYNARYIPGYDVRLEIQNDRTTKYILIKQQNGMGLFGVNVPAPSADASKYPTVAQLDWFLHDIANGLLNQVKKKVARAHPTPPVAPKESSATHVSDDTAETAEQKAEQKAA